MSTERLARACARRPWTTLGAWVLALVLGIGMIVALLDLTSEGELTSNPESERGYYAIGRHFPPDPSEEYVNELILIRSRTSTVDDPAFRDKVDALSAEVESSGASASARASARAARARLRLDLLTRQKEDDATVDDKSGHAPCPVLLSSWSRLSWA